MHQVKLVGDTSLVHLWEAMHPFSHQELGTICGADPCLLQGGDFSLHLGLNDHWNPLPGSPQLVCRDRSQWVIQTTHQCGSFKQQESMSFGASIASGDRLIALYESGLRMQYINLVMTWWNFVVKRHSTYVHVHVSTYVCQSTLFMYYTYV